MKLASGIPDDPTSRARYSAYAFIQSAALIGSASMAASALTFVTNILVARFFGAGPETDALVVGLVLSGSIAPSLISSLDSAFLPRFQRLPRSEAVQLGKETFLWAFACLGILAAAMWLTRESWLKLFLPSAANVPGLDKLVLLGLVGFIALGGTITVQKTLLTAELRFGWIGITSIVPPAVTVACVALFHATGVVAAVGGMALGTTIAMLLACAVANNGWLWTPFSRAYSTNVSRILLENAPVAFSAFLFALSGIAVRAVAALGGPGVLSYQYYAERISLLPHSVLAVSAAAVIMPFILRSNRTSAEIARDVTVYGLMIMTPISIVFLAFGHDLVAVILQHGKFGAVAAQDTAAVIGGYALGLVPLFVIALSWRILQADRKLWRVVLVSAVFLVATSISAVPLLRMLGLFGLGAAYTTGAFAGMIAALWLVFSDEKHVWRILLHFRSLYLVLLANLSMALVSAFGSSAFRTYEPLTRLLLGSTMALSTYVVVLLAFAPPEFKRLHSLLVRWR